VLLLEGIFPGRLVRISHELVLLELDDDALRFKYCMRMLGGRQSGAGHGAYASQAMSSQRRCAADGPPQTALGHVSRPASDAVRRSARATQLQCSPDAYALLPALTFQNQDL